MELSINEGLTPEDLRPITRVMYATALMPGGKSHRLGASVLADLLLTLTSVLLRVLGTRTKDVKT